MRNNVTTLDEKLTCTIRNSGQNYEKLNSIILSAGQMREVTMLKEDEKLVQGLFVSGQNSEKLTLTMFSSGQNREMWFLKEDKKLNGTILRSGQNREVIKNIDGDECITTRHNKTSATFLTEDEKQ